MAHIKLVKAGTRNRSQELGCKARFTMGAQRILGVESADELPLDPGSIPATC